MGTDFNVLHLVRPVHMPQTGWSFLNVGAVPSGKDNVPWRCFPNSNLGKEHCTTLPLVLHWKSRLTDLNGGHSIGSQTKTHLLLLDLFLWPPRKATKLSLLCRWSGHPDQHYRPLSAPIRLSSPCCLVLQRAFSQWPPKQINIVRTEAQSINSTIMGNSKLNKYSHLVEYSWQTQSLDTLRYPTTVSQHPYPLKAKTLNPELIPSPCVHPFLYPFYPNITHIIGTSLCDALMMLCSFWWETHAHVSLH